MARDDVNIDAEVVAERIQLAREPCVERRENVEAVVDPRMLGLRDRAVWILCCRGLRSRRGRVDDRVVTIEGTPSEGYGYDDRKNRSESECATVQDGSLI